MSLPKPYYQDHACTIYHGDAVSLLAAMPEETAHCVITDPPYGTKKNLRDGWMAGEFSNVMPLVLPELYRVGTEDGALYCFTSWTMLADWCLRISPYYRQFGLIAWDKGRHSGRWSAYSWQFHWEAIYYGLKGPRTIKDYQPDVLRVPKDKGSAPMQKPVSLLRRLITASTVPGETVIDPFLGTGSSLVAARETGRKAIGIEIDERYCELAAKRLQEVLPLEVS